MELHPMLILILTIFIFSACTNDSEIEPFQVELEVNEVIDEQIGFCGDGIINEDEECDDMEFNGIPCTPLYNQSCDYCSENCNIISVFGGYCGDMIVQKEEECDKGKNNSDTCHVNTGSCTICTTSCQIKMIHATPTYIGGGSSGGSGGSGGGSSNIAVPVCGNNIVEVGEECDLGDANGVLCDLEGEDSCEYCSSDCLVISIFAPDPFEELRFGLGATQEYLLGQAPEWDIDVYTDLLVSELIVIKNGARLDNIWLNSINDPPTWDNLDAQVDYLESIGKKIKIHYIWSGRNSLLPDGFDDLTPEGRLEFILGHTRNITERYAGRIAMYDVVNHPVRDGEHENYLGTNLTKLEVIAMLFNQTSEIDPDAILVINEGGVVVDTSPIWPITIANEDDYYEMIEALLNESVPIDCIGFMVHAIYGEFEEERAERVLDRFSEFNVPLCITEFDIMRPDESEPYDPQSDWWIAQGEEYEKAYNLFTTHPLVKSIIAWELSDGSSWRPGAALVTYNDPRLNLEDDGFLSSGNTLQRVIEINFSPSENISRSVLYEEGGLQRGINIYIDSQTAHAYIWNYAADSPTFEPIHLSGEYTGESSVKFVHHANVITELFIDGQSVGTGLGGGLYPRVGLTVGGANNTRFHDGAYGLWGYHYSGNMSSVRVWNTTSEADPIIDLNFSNLEGFSCSECPTLETNMGIFNDFRYIKKPSYFVYSNYTLG